MARGRLCPRFNNRSLPRDADPGERGGRRRMLGGMLRGMLLLFGPWSPALFFLEGSSKERGLRTAGKGLFSF